MAEQTRRVALITGAAKRLGAATTRALHARGLNVIIHFRHSEDEARKLASELDAVRTDSAQVLQADLDDPDAVRDLARRAASRWGRIDVLVNNASSFYPTPLDRATDGDWTRLVHSNLRAPFILTQELAGALAAGDGAIVNLVDIYATRPLRDFSLYSLAKAGLASLTRSAARELAPAVRVNGVAPGPVLWPEEDPARRAEVLAATPLARNGTPADVAGAVVWLALDAPFVTGQILAVDGGRSLALAGG